MDKFKLLDLFCGTKSVAKVAESLGYEICTFDIDSKCEPDICADILEFDYKAAFVPGQFDVIWCSPPCDTFSVARRSNIGRMVTTLAPQDRVKNARLQAEVTILATLICLL